MPDLSQLTDEQLTELYKQAYGPAAADVQLPQREPDTSTLATKHQQKIAAKRYADINDPTRGIPDWQLALEGTGQGIADITRHAGNLIGLVPDQAIADAAQIDAPLRATRAGDVGSFIGSTAALSPLTMGTSGLLSRAGAPIASALSRPIVRGAFEGGVQGAIQGNPGDRISSTLRGAAFGTALPAAGRAYEVGKSGFRRTAEGQRLLDEGIDLTPGQMNPDTAHNQLEQAWQSVPVVGQILQGARDNAQRDFQRVAIQKGAAPGTKIDPAQVHDMLSQAYASFEPLYDQAKGFPVKPEIFNAGKNVPLKAAFSDAASSKGIRATDSARKSVDSWLDNLLTQLPTIADSADLLKIRSSIRTEIRNAKLAGGADDIASAQLLARAEQSVTDSLDSQLPQKALDAVKQGDSKYGIYKVLEDAVAKSKDMPGGFTPSHLSQAVYNSTPDAIYARGGGGPLRQLASDAKATLSQTEPKTGSRMGPIALPAMLMAMKPAVAIPAALGALGLAGTRTGRLLSRGETGTQQLLQKLDAATIRKLPPVYRDIVAEMARRGSVNAGLLSTGD